MQVIAPNVWRSRRETHRTRLEPWVEAHRRRAARGQKHPVYDFLFTYYSFRPAHLLRWSPGVNCVLQGATQNEIDWPEHFVHSRDGWLLSSANFPVQRLGFLEWVIAYQESIQARDPHFGCFGLHEWAMVYRTDRIRHAQVPLRVTADQIDSLVNEQGLRCTHYDAFRFFTPAAAPRNRLQLTRPSVMDQDQSACVHATMDLYKFAYKLSPYICAELVAEAFELARKAREIDMRASPYDLSHLGFSTIPVETRAGREEYVNEQRKLSMLAEPIRRQLLEACNHLRDAVTKS